MKKPALLRLPRTSIGAALDVIERYFNRLLVETTSRKFDQYFIGENIPSAYNYVIGNYSLEAANYRSYAKMTAVVEEDGSSSGGLFRVRLDMRRAGSSVTHHVFEIEIDTTSSPTGGWFSASTDTVIDHSFENLERGDTWTIEVSSSSGTHRNVTVAVEYDEFIPYTGRSGHAE